MKRIGAAREPFTFSLSKLEEHVLRQVLQLYPLVPPAHHQLQKNAPPSAPDDNQRLLDEALAEQRSENRRRVDAFLQEPERFRAGKSRVRFTLTAVEIDWLLQVLNDIRIGAWLALGEPEELDATQITPDTAPYFFAMEAVGSFQADLLAALGLHQPSLPDEE